MIKIAKNNTTVIFGDDQQYLNHFIYKNPSAFFGFSNLSKFVDYVENIEPTLDGYAWNDNLEFTGTKNMSEAIEMARSGWQDGLNNVNDIIEKIHIDHATRRFRTHKITGGSVNVGRMLSGNPKHMRARIKQPGQKIVTIFVEAGMHCGITVETAVLRAGLVAAICDIMENQGYSCEIVVIDTSLNNNLKCVYQLSVKIKEAGQRLNIADCVFALGHPSFLRRFSFASVLSTEILRSIHKTQGKCADAFTNNYKPSENEFYIKKITPEQQAIISYDNPLSALKFIKPPNLPIEINP